MFKLDIPFLDMRIGVQGVGESFSFIVSKHNPKRLRYSNIEKEQE